MEFRLKRMWFLTEQAEVLVKLGNHTALHFPVLVTDKFQNTRAVNTAKKKKLKPSSSVNPCTTDVWTMKGCRRRIPLSFCFCAPQ